MIRYAPILLLPLWPIAASAAPPALCADAPNQTAGTLCAKRKSSRSATGIASANGSRPRYADDLSSIVIEDSGHFVPEEAPDAFCDALGRFLAA